MVCEEKWSTDQRLDFLFFARNDVFCDLSQSVQNQKNEIYMFYTVGDKTEPKSDPDYTRKNLTTGSKSANKPLTSCLRTACYKLSTRLEQLITCM